MKKHLWISVILTSLALVAGNVMPAMADSVKVVTLGADLSQTDKDKMLKYFKVDSSQVQILSITNADERAHLSKYFSDSVIGTRTVSCAYVKPTESGGIKVRTANLNKVTCNMIASILSTSGVSNCEVVAACPFEVSGTGALTGIMMAYETASGEKLDETKKEIATEELKVTGDLAADVGQDEATTVVNQSKIEVIGNDIHNGDDIQQTVINVSQQNGISLSQDQIDTIVSLLEQIADQDYDYDEMKETLENVDENVTGESPAADPDDEEIVEEDPDSIIIDLDESILGDDVIADSTEDPTLAEQSAGTMDEDEEEWDVFYGDDEEELETVDPEEDDYIEGQIYDEQTQIDENTDEQKTDASDELNTDSLDATEQGLFDHAETFARGEYQGDEAALEFELGSDAVVTVSLDSETGKKLSKEVLTLYLDILKNGTGSYVWADTDVYFTTELNMLDQQLRQLFTIDGAQPLSGTEDILSSIPQEDKNTLYADTMHFFEKLYDESTDEILEEANVDDSYEEESYEEMPYEEETYDTESYE